MKANITRVLSTACLGAVFSTSAWAGEPVTPKLTDQLRQLLQQEMRSIQAAMITIHASMVMGYHDAVAENAQQIHDSFILEQSLTEQDHKDLMAAVPAAFLEIDSNFHQLAASLADAGRNRNIAEQHRLFSEMTQSCLQCHGAYVFDRFPGLEQSRD